MLSSIPSIYTIVYFYKKIAYRLYCIDDTDVYHLSHVGRGRLCFTPNSPYFQAQMGPSHKWVQSQTGHLRKFTFDIGCAIFCFFG